MRQAHARVRSDYTPAQRSPDSDNGTRACARQASSANFTVCSDPSDPNNFAACADKARPAQRVPDAAPRAPARTRRHTNAGSRQRERSLTTLTQIHASTVLRVQTNELGKLGRMARQLIGICVLMRYA